jgi:ferric-dicitrate binding protein FerR (iron transport regulator)
MPASFPPIDAATLTALNSGDEAALERIFRSHYDALLANARAQLKEDTPAAPRLVMATMRELWEQRATFKAGAEVAGFLNEEIRHRATAIRARMAAVHRFEKSEHVQGVQQHEPPTADALWADIVAALHQPPVDAEASSRNRREHAKHEAAQHIARVAEPRAWKGPLALGLVAAAVGIFAFWYIGKASKESVITEMLAAEESRAIATLGGQRGSLTLADGSAVRLGAQSRIVVVPEFGKKYRTARLTGSVEVTVAAGNAVPLEAIVGDMAAELSAGVLTVRHYAEDIGFPGTMIRVDGGEARVRTAAATRTLAAGQSVVLDSTGTLRDATAEEVAQAFAWTVDELVLADVSLADALWHYRRWFGIDVGLDDPALGERRVSVIAPLASERAAITALEEQGQVESRWVETRRVLYDAPPVRRR